MVTVELDFLVGFSFFPPRKTPFAVRLKAISTFCYNRICIEKDKRWRAGAIDRVDCFPKFKSGVTALLIWVAKLEVEKE